MEDSDTGSQHQRASEIIDGGVLDADGGATDGGQLGGGGQVAKFRNWTLTKLGHALEAGISKPNQSLDTRYKEQREAYIEAPIENLTNLLNCSDCVC